LFSYVPITRLVACNCCFIWVLVLGKHVLFYGGLSLREELGFGWLHGLFCFH